MLGLWTSELERNWKRKSKFLLCFIFIVLVAINLWGLTTSKWGEYRFGEGRILLNDLNVPWFTLNGVSLILVAALLPMIYVEHLSGELHSGAYRLYALRPYRRFQLWLGKLLALATTTAIFIILTYIISMLGAKLFFPHHDTTSLYSSKEEVGRFTGEWYTVKFYAVMLLVCWAKLMLCSVVCVFISRPLVAFLAVFGLSIILYHYVAIELVVLFDPFQQILLALRPEGSLTFWLYLFGSMLIFTVISFVGWQRKVI